MRTWEVIISMVVAVAIAATTSVAIGILIALCCVVYQMILSHGRTATFKTLRRAMFWGVIVRNGVFLVPLIIALMNGLWFTAGATVVVFGVNLMMS